MLRRGQNFARSRSPRRGSELNEDENRRRLRCAGSFAGNPLASVQAAQLRTGIAAREPISLRTPRLCRTIQVSRTVERVPGLCFLESNAVAPETMENYRKAVADLEMYASEIGHQLDWRNGMEVERTCLEYLDLLFTQGFGPEVGNRLIAAIRTLFPRYSRHGDLDMPRIVKAMKGWTRLTPSLSRWPLPWTMVAAALVTLWRRRKPVVVAAIALSDVAYLRPGELATLRVRNLVEPIRPGSTGATGRFSLVIREEQSGIPSKTNTFDDSVILDRPDLLWMDRLWRALKTGRPEHALLIPVSQNDLAHDIKNIFEELGCSKLAIVAYSLRHGGPSWDFMKKSAVETKFSNGDVGAVCQACYDTKKTSKLLSAMQLVQPRQAEFGRYCEDNLERLLAAPMGGQSFHGLDIDASLRSGMLRRV